MVVLFKLPVQIELAHPHDLLTRRFLIDHELMSSMLEHYDNTGIVRLLDLDALRCESPVTIDAKLQEVIGDLRFSAKFKNGAYSNVFLFFEHQSKKIKLYSLHCLRKILVFYEEWAADPKNAVTENGKFPYPLVVVLYHGDRSWNELLQIKDLITVPPGVNGNVLWFQIIVIDLSKIQRKKLQGHPALMALFDTLQSYSEGKLPENLERIIGYFNDVKTDPRTMGWLTSIAHYTLAAAKISKDVIIREFSKILDRKGAENMIMSTMEEWYTNGKLEGKIETSIEAVLKLLNKRFEAVPESVSSAVHSYSDIVVLNSLFDRALECETLAEFEQNLVPH
jgi:hypothetical protein